MIEWYCPTEDWGEIIGRIVSGKSDRAREGVKRRSNDTRLF